MELLDQNRVACRGARFSGAAPLHLLLLLRAGFYPLNSSEQLLTASPWARWAGTAESPTVISWALPGFPGGTWQIRVLPSPFITGIARSPATDIKSSARFIYSSKFGFSESGGYLDGV